MKQGRGQAEQREAARRQYVDAEYGIESAEAAETSATPNPMHGGTRPTIDAPAGNASANRTSMDVSGTLREGTPSFKKMPPHVQAQSSFDTASGRSDPNVSWFDMLAIQKDEGDDDGADGMPKELHLFFPNSESKYILDPRSNTMLRWLLALLLVTLYTSISTPIEIAWYPSPEELSEGAQVFLLVTNIIITVVFVIDIIINFNLAVITSDAALTRRRDIAYVYFKFWFWIDMLATIPFDWITGSSSSQILRLFKLLRLGRLAKILGSKRVLRSFEADHAIDYDSMYLAKFGALLLLMMHLMACGLFIVAELAGEDETFIDGNSIGTFNVWNQWLFGYYWAAMTVSTIGYGDVSLVNQPERGYATVCMLMGASLYAYMVGALIGVILNMDVDEEERKVMLSQMNELMSDMKLPHGKKRRVRAFFSKSGAVDIKTLRDYKDHFLKLSPTLGAMIVQHIHEPWLPSVWWMKSKDKNFYVDLGLIMDNQSFAPKEHVFHRSDSANFMYVRRSGAFSIMGKRGRFFAKGTVGEEIILKRTPQYGYTCLSTDYSDSWMIEKKDLDELYERYPDMLAKKRWAEIMYYLRHGGGVKAILERAAERDLDKVDAALAQPAERSPPKGSRGVQEKEEEEKKAIEGIAASDVVPVAEAVGATWRV